jgi:type IV secretory pathway VirJ component
MVMKLLERILIGGMLLIASGKIIAQENGMNKKLEKLPLKEFNSPGKGDSFILLLTGDGGWRDLTNSIGNYFSERNMPVIGINSRSYFWSEKKRQQVAGDITTVIHHYSEKWKRKNVIIIGYSFGADVLPLVFNALPPDVKNMTKYLVLIAPGQHANFIIKLMEYFSSDDDGIPILPELDKITKIPVYIICDDDKHALCHVLSDNWDYQIVEGGHHFNDRYDKINALIEKKIAGR